MYAARSWGYRHPYVGTGVRITAATWNLVLGILLLSHGYRWGLAGKTPSCCIRATPSNCVQMSVTRPSLRR